MFLFFELHDYLVSTSNRSIDIHLLYSQFARNSREVQVFARNYCRSYQMFCSPDFLNVRIKCRWTQPNNHLRTSRMKQHEIRLIFLPTHLGVCRVEPASIFEKLEEIEKYRNEWRLEYLYHSITTRMSSKRNFIEENISEALHSHPFKLANFHGLSVANLKAIKL